MGRGTTGRGFGGLSPRLRTYVSAGRWAMTCATRCTGASSGCAEPGSVSVLWRRGSLWRSVRLPHAWLGRFSRRPPASCVRWVQ